MKIRIIDTEPMNAFMNMAIDESLSNTIKENPEEIIFRLYTWKPAALSLGYFQKFHKEVNEVGLKQRFIDVVRRPTGGRAVLHDDEVTYSILISKDSPIFKKSVTESYKQISESFLYSLEYLGLKNIILQKPLGSKLPHTSSACFDAPSSYELVCNGKKIIGSAQKRFKHGLLQHGSIPITMDVDLLFDCLKIEKKDKINVLKKYFKRQATSINEELDKPITKIQLKNALIEGIKKGFGYETYIDNVNERELTLANKLNKEKYSTKEWNYRF